MPGIESRLSQVFLNIIANAVSFSPPDGGPPGGEIRIRAARSTIWRAERDRVGDDVQEHLRQPALDARHATARIAVEEVGGEVLQLGDALQPGVAGPDEDVVEVLLAPLEVVDRLGDLQGCARERSRSPIASGSDLNPSACSASPGTGSVRLDGAERLPRGGRSPIFSIVALDRPRGDDVARRVRARDVPEPEVVALGQRLAQRDDDVPGLQRAAARAGQQRRVEHEVRVGNNGDARRCAAASPHEGARGVEAAESPAQL